MPIGYWYRWLLHRAHWKRGWEYLNLWTISSSSSHLLCVDRKKLNFLQEPEHILYLKLIVGPFKNQKKISAWIYVGWELRKKCALILIYIINSISCSHSEKILFSHAPSGKTEDFREERLSVFSFSTRSPLFTHPAGFCAAWILICQPCRMTLGCHLELAEPSGLKKEGKGCQSHLGSPGTP